MPIATARKLHQIPTICSCFKSDFNKWIKVLAKNAQNQMKKSKQ